MSIIATQGAVDAISEKNVCNTPIDNLQEITIKQLTVGKPIPNTIIWLKTITEAGSGLSIKLLVRDNDKECAMLGLYN